MDETELHPPSNPVLVRLVKVIAVVAVIQVSSISAFILIGSKSLPHKAVIGMILGLVLFWIITGGLLALRYKQAVRCWVLRLPGSWQLKFVIFATVMALLEEVVTVSMTNCAPLFGVKMGQAYITASANYFDVVLGHSVIVFIPQYIAWAWVLTKYQLSPVSVFLIYGVQGLTGEAMFGGVAHLLNMFWMFVYGMMVYLPAYCIPVNRGAVRADWGIIWRMFVLFISPGLFAAVVMKLHPVKIHFPPIAP